MTSRVLRGRVRACIRLAAWPLRLLARAGRTVFVALAAALGAPPPRFIRHEDPVVQVDGRSTTPGGFRRCG
jgi:hypothetical protein